MEKYIVYMHDSMPAPLNNENKENHFFEFKFFNDENTAIDFAKSQGSDTWIKIEVMDILTNKIVYEA